MRWTFATGNGSLHKQKLFTPGTKMRHIMVMNAKGGCGKSTLATNIAAYFAHEGYSVALADYDPQRSSLDWLDRRPENRPEIVGIAGYDEGLKHAPRSSDIIVIDAPARSHGTELTDLVRHAETIIVPVLPSTIDIQATQNFLKELRAVGKIERKEAKFGIVANRFREYTLIWQELDDYLASVRAPYLAALREAQNYVRAYTRGLGVHELPEYLAWPDWEQWQPLVKWLKSVRSQP
jgi:chromosome partitioning protein